MEMQACSSCGKQITGSDVLYTEDARIVCASCQGAADIVSTDKRAAGNIWKAAWSSVGMGVVAFGAGFAMLGIITYLLVAMAIVPAVFAMQGVARGNERFTQHLTSGQQSGIWMLSIIGIILAGLTALGVPGLIAVHVIGFR